MTEGTIVFHMWDEQGIREIEQPFGSLDELFSLCVKAGDSAGAGESTPRLHRVILRGEDAQGKARTITLAFESVSGREGTPA